MPKVENKGNLVTRRAFSGENFERSHRMPTLRRIVNKAMSTAYRMTEEVGEFGSGTPSPLHQVCEQIRELERHDREDGCEISTAQEVADYPALFLRELRREKAPNCDPFGKMNFLLKTCSDANYSLRAREMKQLSPGELKEFRQKMMNASEAARELVQMADALILEGEEAYASV